MARILEVQTKVSIQQTALDNGEFYPAVIWANLEFIERFENCLIIAKSLIQEGTDSSEIVNNILHGLSNYRLYKEKNKSKEELPTEIEPHFGLLPDFNASIDMEFKPVNNVPTQALLYSFDEVDRIASALFAAEMEADEEQREIILPFSEAFVSFRNNWIESKERTGSVFAQQEIM